MGDRLEEDLRHEATHALLHVAVGDLPLWLDEGLAEYFEVHRRPSRPATPSTSPGCPRTSATGWTPDLARLETLETSAR